MKHFSHFPPLFFLLLILLAAGCNPSRKLQEGESLLKKNTLNIDKNNQVDAGDLTGFIRQKPNKKMLGIFPLRLSAHFYASKGKERWFKRYLKMAIAEEPVILDTTLTRQTAYQMELYLNSKGYFYSQVFYQHKFYEKRKKLSKVIYTIKLSEPYTIRNISYQSADLHILYEVLGDTSNSILKSGINYDVDVFEGERSRITKYLRNKGYFYFTKEFITYRIDSVLNNHQMDVFVQINQKRIKSPDDPEKTIAVNHNKYFINRIYIYPDFKPFTQDTSLMVTEIFEVEQHLKKYLPSRFYFVYQDSMEIKPKTYTQSVFIRSNSCFNLDDVQKTYERLSELRNFKYVNITFTESKQDDAENDTAYLDCKIQLTRYPVQLYSIETEGTNSAGNPGIAGNLLYQHKNLFHGAEIFNLKLKGALEIQRVIGGEEAKAPLFNTFETGLEGNIEIPKFLIPIRQERFPKYFKPKTNIKAGFNFQKRPDYSRFITDISFGYEWKENPQKKHILYPAVLNSVRIFPDSSFSETIRNYSKTLQNQYTDHFISAIQYSFIFSNQDIYKKQNFIFFRANVETAGNLLSLGSTVSASEKDTNAQYLIFNIPFAQYVKVNTDFRYYHLISSHSSLIFRSFIGIGVPYGNLKVLPYEKSYNAGGSNDIRAWKLRSIGPGGYVDTSNSTIDKIGDLKLEFNIENRFPISKLLFGAFFIDLGNIWLLKESTEFTDGAFSKDFYKEIAIGGGAGLRFDFDFFVLRFDFAVPLRDPQQPRGKRWVIDEIKFRKFILNFGIGYPF